ncbi:hypothetical protein [Bacillus glycinifermentans]|uniref:hypothetical protein n=1 Tax=Bacillus glycinifermentans TaxID=1664069 RepID=UPI000BC2E6C4|nr:hypothetical protein [Bacillus glycinifermentans]ATH91703.1 hypothetical protein COP00_02995 [Bacillus glycinifermentans]
MVKVKALRNYLNKLVELDDKNDDLTLTVVTKGSSAGALPQVPVKSVTQGFDWESGRLLIRTVKSKRKWRTNN